MLAFLPKQRVSENRLLLFLGHASLPYTYICSRAKGLPFARTLSATSPKCQDSKCRDVRRGEGGSFAAIRRSIERSACRLAGGTLLFLDLDLVHVQAREQRVAHGDRVAGGQLAPLRGALDVHHVGDLAQAQAIEDLV